MLFFKLWKLATLKALTRHEYSGIIHSRVEKFYLILGVNKMHCSHCSSLMAEIETQKDVNIEQSRYECPVCRRTQLVTRTLDQWKDHLALMSGRLAKQALRYP